MILCVPFLDTVSLYQFREPASITQISADSLIWAHLLFRTWAISRYTKEWTLTALLVVSVRPEMSLKFPAFKGSIMTSQVLDNTP